MNFMGDPARIMHGIIDQFEVNMMEADRRLKSLEYQIDQHAAVIHDVPELNNASEWLKWKDKLETDYKRLSQEFESFAKKFKKAMDDQNDGFKTIGANIRSLTGRCQANEKEISNLGAALAKIMPQVKEHELILSRWQLENPVELGRRKIRLEGEQDGTGS